MELRDDRANYQVASRADIALLRIIDCEFKKRAQSEGSLKHGGFHVPSNTSKLITNQVPIKLPPWLLFYSDDGYERARSAKYADLLMHQRRVKVARVEKYSKRCFKQDKLIT